MSNEIWTSYEKQNSLYALVWKEEVGQSSLVWDKLNSQFIFYDPDDVDNYDIVLAPDSEFSNYYVADFPVEITEANSYNVQIFLKIGGTPNNDDFPIAQGVIYWNGTSEDTPVSLSDQMDNLSAQGSRVLNKYPTRSQPDV